MSKDTPRWLMKRDRAVIIPQDMVGENKEGLVCWWCTESLPQLPCLHFPIKYDSHLDRFTTIGNFCSWECAKAYGKNTNSPRWGEYSSYLAMMRRRAYGAHKLLFAAPAREALKKFGGTMTIEEFRSYRGKTAPVVFFPHDVQIHHLISDGGENIRGTHMPGGAGGSSVGKMKAIESSEVKGDTLRLKRGKPLERSKSKLETSLGIKRKEK